MSRVWKTAARQPKEEKTEDPVTVLVTGFGVSIWFIYVFILSSIPFELRVQIFHVSLELFYVQSLLSKILFQLCLKLFREC